VKMNQMYILDEYLGDLDLNTTFTFEKEKI